MRHTPIIGLGCQRSGTSVTGHILASPAMSGFRMENGIIRMSLIWFSNALDDGTALAASRFTEFLRALMCRSESHGTPLRAAAAQAIASYQTDGRLQHWINTDDGVSFVKQLCFDVLTRGQEVAYWGDKYPEHLFFSDELRRVFPQARWLFVWRQPASVMEALSRKIIPSMRRPVSDWRFSVEDCATQWVAWNRKWLKIRDTLPDDQQLELSFDEFVSDPPAQLRRLSEFIGFDLVADKASMNRARSLRPADLEKWRASERVAEIETQLDRDDVQTVYAELRRQR